MPILTRPILTHNALHLSHHELVLPNLPSSLDGFKLLQLSDLHFYEYTDWAYYERVRAEIDAWRPDAIALTGDVIHYGDRHLARAARYLSRLSSPCGRYAVLGNHDYYDGRQGQGVCAALDEAGFAVLVNDACEVAEGLWMAGLDDLWCGLPDIDRALAPVPEDACTVMLAHNPLLFDPVAAYSRRAIDLQLSGHTHAGHVFIPFLMLVHRHVFKMKYQHQLYERNGVQLHVSSGVGSAAFYIKHPRYAMGLPRFRFNTLPELACLVLRSAGAVGA